MLRLADGTAAGVRAFCADLCPGDTVGLWYDDDSVWHHRTLLYPASPEEWWTLSPDGDYMVENIACQDAEGCNRAFRIDREGNRPSVGRGSFTSLVRPSVAAS